MEEITTLEYCPYDGYCWHTENITFDGKKCESIRLPHPDSGWELIAITTEFKAELFTNMATSYYKEVGKAEWDGIAYTIKGISTEEIKRLWCFFNEVFNMAFKHKDSKVLDTPYSKLCEKYFKENKTNTIIPSHYNPKTFLTSNF